jgi:hypothetical protein
MADLRDVPFVGALLALIVGGGLILLWLGEMVKKKTRERFPIRTRLIEDTLITEFDIGEEIGGIRRGWVRKGGWDYKVEIVISDQAIKIDQNPYAPVNEGEMARMKKEAAAWLQAGH